MFAGVAPMIAMGDMFSTLPSRRAPQHNLAGPGRRALMFGGLTQVIAGIIQLRTGKTFSGVLFTGFGGFWLSLFAVAQWFLKAVPAAQTISGSSAQHNLILTSTLALKPFTPILAALALSYFERLGSLTIKSKGQQDMASEADLNVEILIRDRLKQAFPEDDFLGVADPLFCLH